MRAVVITHTDNVPGEARLLRLLLDAGIDTIHLRKPRWTSEQVAGLLDALREECRGAGRDAGEIMDRIVIHYHHYLASRYGLRGIHLSLAAGTRPAAGAGSSGEEPLQRQKEMYYSVGAPHQRSPLRLTASCHSLEEVARMKPSCDYVFLSPIFDSISKQGYKAAFTPEQIEAAQGIIDQQVVALGGMSLERVPLVRGMGFGGAAFLGDVWQHAADERAFVSHAAHLSDALHSI